MGVAVTHGVRIMAWARFEPRHSDPHAGRYLFSYRITITNRTKDTIQLLRRHWVITDSLGPMREVEGQGVVGQQPVLEPGEEFSYSSACDLRSGFGRMQGTYRMIRMRDGHLFDVRIPEMQLLFPHAAN
jgi:ApaG protein